MFISILFLLILRLNFKFNIRYNNFFIISYHLIIRNLFETIVKILSKGRNLH